MRKQDQKAVLPGICRFQRQGVLQDGPQMKKLWEKFLNWYFWNVLVKRDLEFWKKENSLQCELRKTI